jgi:small-conductance mechanosensitive channel
MAEKLPPIDNLLSRLIQDSHDTALLVQLAVLALGIALGWVVIRTLRPRLDKLGETWSAGAEGLQRIGLPLAILAVLFLLREGLRLFQAELHLLNLALPLLSALVLVRLLIYALRYALKPSATLKAWERTISWVIWIGVAMHITGVLPRVRAAMATVAFESGSHKFSLLLLFEALTVIIIAIILALWLAQFIESRLMRVPHLDLSLRMALSKAARTFLLVLAVLVALPAVGIDLTVLSVFGGALGVGLGFGLQKVASNYVSGFIILLDRSVRMGDMITVDNKYGQVAEINTRYTLVRAQDGTESIVPNEMLITQTVVNHSLSKPDVRIELPVQVAYSTDLEVARDLMIEVAMRNPRVIAAGTEMPKVFIRDFGDNGINLDLAIWIKDAEEGQLSLRSDIYWDIWKAFKQAGIEIPFPQRVVHLIQEKTV